MQSFFGRNGENLDAFKHTAAQTGEFAYDDTIPWLRVFEQSGKVSFAPGDFPGNFLFNKGDVAQVFSTL